MHKFLKKTIKIVLAFGLMLSIVVGLNIFSYYAISVIEKIEATPIITQLSIKKEKRIKQETIDNFNNNFYYFDIVQKYVSSSNTELNIWEKVGKLKATVGMNNGKDIDVPIKKEVLFLIDNLDYWMVDKEASDNRIMFFLNNHFFFDRLNRDIIYEENVSEAELDGAVRLRENWYYKEWIPMGR